MNIIDCYQKDLAQGVIRPDAKQERVIYALQTRIEQYQPQLSLWQRLRQTITGKKPINGLYLWGGVGIGKTYMMDLFFQCFPGERKVRMHFHRFMKQVHDELKCLQGEKDPLIIIAKNFSINIDVICFDEFFVTDIADAMILGGLLEALFARGICLIATSNIEPDELYKNGLQRARFLPAIECIKQHTEVFHLAIETDYRLRVLEKAGVYFSSLDHKTQEAMHACFQQFSHGVSPTTEPIIINERSIPVVQCANDIVWFDFDVICNVPRSQNDYLEIATLFNAVMVSNVPKIAPEQDTLITYFIHLVDVFYDANVKLIISSEVPIEEIYPSGRKHPAFRRTQSRLQEMQSRDYLHRAHSQR